MEIAVGIGRNLPLYPEDVRLTGIELSPMMLAVARSRAREERLEADLRVGDAQDLQFSNASSTAWSRRSRSAPSPTTGGRLRRLRGFYAPAVVFCCWSTSEAPFFPYESRKHY